MRKFTGVILLCQFGDLREGELRLTIHSTSVCSHTHELVVFANLQLIDITNNLLEIQAQTGRVFLEYLRRADR